MLSSVEQRLSTWNELMRKKKAEERDKDVYTITLSREYGCEGFPLAEALKVEMEKKTGKTWSIFDKALIEGILEDHEISRNLLENLGERPWFLDNLISHLMPLWKTDAEIYKLMSETIYTLAKAGNCIIVGRGGAVLTQDIAQSFHFRIEAPIDFRLNSLQKRGGISIDEAKTLLKEKQQKRDHFLNKFINKNISDIDYYHLVFNNAKVNVKVMAKTVIDFIELNGK